MNRVIRRGVFETNSSSCHSITIESGEFIADTLPVDADGVCQIHTGEFGWETESYNDAATKAAYCLTFLKSLPDGGEFRDVKPEDAPSLDVRFQEVIKNQTGAKSVVYVSSGGDWSPWGYIDHQSHYVCEEAFESPEKLRAFIFNPASTLDTDNDNH